MQSDSVERTIWIDAPRERVWKAVTTAQMIEQWWGDTWIIDAMEVGGKVKFGIEPDFAHATITIFDPPETYALQWEPMEAFPAIFTTHFTLTAEDSGTRVTVVEAGFKNMPDELRQKRMDSTGEGYTIVLTTLKKLVEQENT